ncbi:hypothetical protein [Kibdelosporangium philippinense]|uniref:hypothetical protein n=1 Tax=Kibdelosporangium philippinense TaxID=211113 RepID=UPI00361820C2
MSAGRDVGEQGDVERTGIAYVKSSKTPTAMVTAAFKQTRPCTPEVVYRPEVL